MNWQRKVRIVCDLIAWAALLILFFWSAAGVMHASVFSHKKKVEPPKAIIHEQLKVGDVIKNGEDGQTYILDAWNCQSQGIDVQTKLEVYFCRNARTGQHAQIKILDEPKPDDGQKK